MNNDSLLIEGCLIRQWPYEALESSSRVVDVDEGGGRGRQLAAPGRLHRLRYEFSRGKGFGTGKECWRGNWNENAE